MYEKLKFSLLPILLLLFCGSVHAQGVPVTGNLRDLGLNNATTQASYVQFTLQNYGANTPRVIGSNIIVQPVAPPFYPNSSGQISGNIQPNDTISPGNTFYSVCVFYQGSLAFPCQNYLINSTPSPFNLNTANPLSTGNTPNAPVPLIAMNWMGTWSNSVAYPANATVYYMGSSYISLIGVNIGNAPATSPSQWGLLTLQGIGPAGPVGPAGPAGPGVGVWSSVTSYSINAVVSYMGFLYVSLVNSNLNNIPASSPSQWQLNGGGR